MQQTSQQHKLEMVINLFPVDQYLAFQSLIKVEEI